MNEYEKLKHYAFIYAYRRRFEKTPKGQVLWSDWWQQKFSDNFNEYLKRAKEKKASD